MNTDRIAARLVFRATPPTDPPPHPTRSVRDFGRANDFFTDMYIIMASNAALLRLSITEPILGLFQDIYSNNTYAIMQ